MRKRAPLLFLFLLSLFGCFLVSPARGQTQARDENQTLALVGAKIYPSPTDKPLVDATVLIKSGRIVAIGRRGKIKIPRNSRVLDCRGMFLTAGFWNSHVHFTELKWVSAGSLPSSRLARQFEEMLTRYGFTHVLDTGSFLANTLALKRRVEKGEVPGPSIRTAGMPFVPPNGTPFYVAPIKLPELSTPVDAARLVEKRLNAGADVIKFFAASPAALNKPPVVMPTLTAQAAVTAAHKLGKAVIVHPTNSAGINVALESGADILAHTTPDGSELWSDELVKKLRARGVALVPTLKLWTWELGRKGVAPAASEKFVNVALGQLRAYSQAGGEILFGTDVGYMGDYDPTDEYLLMKKAGMSFQQILASLTTAPAKRFGLAERTGRIAKGMDADIVLLADDPATEVKAFSNIRYTLRLGTIIYKSR